MYGGLDVLDEYEEPEKIEEFIDFTIKKSVENKQWDLYLAVYPHMTTETFKTFEEFKGNPTKQATSTNTNRKREKTKEEILLEVENLLNSKQ